MGIVYVTDLQLAGEDVTLRAARLLREASLILVRGPHLAQAVLEVYPDARLVRLDGCSVESVLQDILAALDSGDVAWATEGVARRTPADEALLGMILDRGIEVLPVPGGELWSRALILSGLPAHQFTHLGVLPAEAADRQRLLKSMSSEPSTLICEIAGGHVLPALADVQEILGSRPVVVCWGDRCWFLPGEVPDSLGDTDASDAVLVIGAAEPEVAWTEALVREQIRELLADGASARDVASIIAERSGWRKKAVYRLVLDEQAID
jgi:16S rRNA (cytidine1402-2'-O)-methyltransferase